MKKKPTGFVAKCQCGKSVGALDYGRTDRKDAGKMIGKWLADGCTVEPRFAGSWTEHIEPCCCEPKNGTIFLRELHALIRRYGFESSISVYQVIGALRVAEHDLLRMLDRRDTDTTEEQFPDISDGDPDNLAG